MILIPGRVKKQRESLSGSGCRGLADLDSDPSDPDSDFRSDTYPDSINMDPKHCLLHSVLTFPQSFLPA